NVDNDCDGSNLDECWTDADMDGHGVPVVKQDNGGTCAAAHGESTLSDDCDDGNAQRYPGFVITQAQIDDNVDNDCDGSNRDECWTDADGDDHGNNLGLVTQDNGDGVCDDGQEEL